MSGGVEDPEGRKQAIGQLFDRGAAAYDTIGDFFTPMGRDLVALAGVSSGERVLDVGCGRGAVLFAAAAAVGPGGRAVGIDIAREMVALTAAEARGLAHVSVAVGDAEAPDFPPSSFEAILGGLVLFFLPDPAAALERYRALLAPGGRVGFTAFAGNDPNFEAAMKAVGSFVAGDLPGRGDRQGPFGSPDGIQGLLAATGYRPPLITTRTYETRFRDPDEWLAWAWSHGGRATLERVPPDRRPDAEAAAKKAFAGARTASGDYAIRTTIRLTVARPA